MTLEADLEAAGYKQTKEDRKVQMARERILEKILGDETKKKSSSGFADPATMFGK